MSDEIQVYDHPVITAHARRVLAVLAAVAALVLGMMTPAHATAGHLVGTVTEEGSGNPVADVYVDVFDADFSVEEGGVTDSEGHFDVTVPPGTYYVFYFPPNDDYAYELYDDVHGFDLDSATPVVVTDGGSVTADAALTPYASISGHLTRSQGDQNWVLAYDDLGGLAGWGRVAADGSYEVGGLSGGSYRLAFNRLSGFAFSAAEFYDDHAEGQGLGSADVVVLDDGEAAAGMDAVLSEGGHLTGTLQDSDGAAIRCLLQAYTGDDSLVTRSAWSDATTGAFDITGLATGSYHVRVVNKRDCQNGQQYVDADRGPLSADGTAADDVAATLGDSTALAPGLVYDLGPVPTNTVLPTITGAPTVGVLLTANHGTWSPSSHLTYHYQWLADGVPAGTGRTRPVTAADVGKSLAVEVRAGRGSRTATATSAPTARVTAATSTPIVPLTAPQVVGTAAVGRTLLVDPGQWSVPGTTFGYLWSSGPRTVATTSTPSLVVPDSVFKQPLTLTVVAHHPGYADGQAIVPVTSKVAPGSWNLVRAPRVTGPARVGATLRVHPTKVTPQPRLRFQWLRDGEVIPGAQDKHYRLTAADVGHRIRVSVRYGRLHYTHLVVESRPTPPVRG